MSVNTDLLQDQALVAARDAAVDLEWRRSEVKRLHAELDHERHLAKSAEVDLVAAKARIDWLQQVIGAACLSVRKGHWGCVASECPLQAFCDSSRSAFDKWSQDRGEE